jgi:HSP20 family protein
MATMLDIVPRFDVSMTPSRYFERLFNEWFRPSYYTEECEWMPASDVTETEKAYVVTMELPGVDPKSVDIFFNDGIVTIKGEKGKEMAEGESCYCSERYSGSFQRNFSIPGRVDKDNIDATFSHGVLRLTLNKAEESMPKKIQIH